MGGGEMPMEFTATDAPTKVNVWPRYVHVAPFHP
jgi:hypothetical protein